MEKIANVNVNDEEAALHHRIKMGDREAFTRMVGLYAEDLLRQALRWTRDCAQAEDLLQDVFADFWQDRGNIHLSSSLKGYLYRMLRHRFLRLVARGKLHEEASEYLLRHMHRIEHTVLDMMAASDLEQTLSDAIGKLPANMRLVFALRQEDYSLREIAQALGLAEQTVRNYHAELSQRLKHALLAKHPDISHSLLVLIVAGLIQP
ncbi:RNA polymerase sigma factor [Parapedobacter sp. 10938]|uniref:RNA polymerase sigma factor n=1 Tax=Parapedobacter flavus TaxID=3110225 RepID=UPI002DB55770|nr:sigma-70 family RNA polymerase sigma factor [Parapedobacter sp. 10938]MEC3879160.1 sigma-70 family RNA polymerase sigma factor [Parapedobacter sp. 10938]